MLGNFIFKRYVQFFFFFIFSRVQDFLHTTGRFVGGYIFIPALRYFFIRGKTYYSEFKKGHI